MLEGRVGEIELVNYVCAEVSLHGLDAKTAEEVCEKIKKALIEEFRPEYLTSIDVELIESAGRAGD